MDAEQIKRIEDKCKIKSKEQFIQECENNNIPSEWYSFTYDRSKPVSFERNSVYYGKLGVTNCSVLMTIWDVAFKELIRYKKEYEWEQSGKNLKIDKIVIKTTEWTDSGLTNKLGLEFPLVAINTTSYEEEPDQRLIDNGWIPDGYVYYDGLFYYHKVVDIRTIVDKVEISFTKKTEERDKREFGFVDEFTFGAYSYPIPSTLLEDISVCEFENVKKSNSEFVGKYYVPVELRQKIIDSVAKNIIDDEFNALLNLRDEHKQGLFSNIDVKITREEQKNNWAKVSRSIEFKNPAYLKVYGSRSNTVTHHNFDLVHQEYEDIKDTESCLRGAVVSTLMEQYFDDRKFSELEIINNVNIINAPEDRRKEVLTETLALIQNLNTEWNLKVFLSGLLNISCGESIFKINSSHLPRTDTISDWKVGDFQHIYHWQYVLLKTIRAEIAMDEKYYSSFLQILIYAKSILSENSIYMHYYNALYDSSQTLDRIVLAHLRGEAISVLMEQYFDDRKFNEQEIINRINKNVSAPEYKKKEVLSEAIALARTIGEKRVPDVFSRGVLDISCCNDIFDIHSQMLSQINTDAWTDDDLRKISEWRNALLKSVKNVVFTHHWKKDDILIRLLIYAKAIMTETAEYMPYYYALYHPDKLKNVK